MNCSFCRVFGTRLILLLCGHCSPLTRQPTSSPSLATSFLGNLRAFFVLLLSRLSPHASLSGTEGRMEKRVENDEAMINEAASLCPSACTQHAARRCKSSNKVRGSKVVNPQSKHLSAKCFPSPIFSIIDDGLTAGKTIPSNPPS